MQIFKFYQSYAKHLLLNVKVNVLKKWFGGILKTLSCVTLNIFRNQTNEKTDVL